MPFRFSLLKQRRLCGVMLLAWLFALLSGTVNACVLAERAAGPHQHDGHAQHAHEHHGAVQDDRHDGHDDAQERQDALLDEAETPSPHADAHVACHKFCQDESQTLPPNPHRDSADFAPVLIPYGSPLLPEATAVVQSAFPDERPPAHGPPLVIHFLRLTL